MIREKEIDEEDNAREHHGHRWRRHCWVGRRRRVKSAVGACGLPVEKNVPRTPYKFYVGIKFLHKLRM